MSITQISVSPDMFWDLVFRANEHSLFGQLRLFIVFGPY
jgi:hypothetical protein